jgi:hypothetical protein
MFVHPAENRRMMLGQARDAWARRRAATAARALNRHRQRFDMKRILPILALSVLAMLAGSAPSRAEITYPWCAQYGGGRDGSRNCGFWTYQQCMAALWGNGGYCIENAMYRGPQPGMIPPPSPIPGRRG